MNPAALNFLYRPTRPWHFMRFPGEKTAYADLSSIYVQGIEV